MQSVDAVLRQAAADLDAIGARWAVIGGLAVAFRSEPRFTKDVDLADDREAEGIVNRLQVRGYALASLVEQDYVNRLEVLPDIQMPVASIGHLTHSRPWLAVTRISRISAT